MMLSDGDMTIEYDDELQSYYIVCTHMAAAGLGKTKQEALADLREAAHFGIDTTVDLKLVQIGEKESRGHGEQG